MFWNDGHGRLYGRFAKKGVLTGDEAIVAADGAWEGFLESLPDDETLAKASPEETAEIAGFEPDGFGKAMEGAMRAWRVSPSRSLINASAFADDPAHGHMLFPDLRRQTRTLCAAVDAGLIGERSLHLVPGPDGKPLVHARNAYALTATGDAAATLNALVRAVRTWEERTRAATRTGMITPPARLWRGVRSNDVPLPEGFAAPEGVSDPIATCERIAAKRRALAEGVLEEVSGSPLLSFTENRRIAEFFTKDEGFVVEADTSGFDFVACHALHPGLSGKDEVTGRNEREWIARPRGYVPGNAAVTFNHRWIAQHAGSPEGVRMLDHDDREAAYSKAGRHVTAQFHWNSKGSNGAVRFRIDGGYSLSRAEVRKRFGFDPLPSPGDGVEEVAYTRLPERYTGRGRREPLERWEGGVTPPPPLPEALP